VNPAMAPHPLDDVESRVVVVIARAMERPVSDVSLSSSLEEDLGAQSLDFLDIAFSLEREFRIQFPRTDFLQRASDHFGEANLVKDGVVTPFGLQLLALGMPEIDPAKFKPGLRVTELQKMFTVATFIRVARQLLESKAGMDRRCPNCKAELTESSALPEFVCNACQTVVPVPSGDEVLFLHLLAVEQQAKDAGVGAS
jgi:acyl carrier protein